MERRLSSVAVILETKDNKALIVKTSYKPYWTFPGGVIDAGETPLQAAVREVKEEIGVALNESELDFVAVVTRTSDMAHTYQFLFKLAEPLTQEMVSQIVLEEAEIVENALITKKEALSNNRAYGKVIGHWAHNKTGYIEQTFDRQG